MKRIIFGLVLILGIFASSILMAAQPPLNGWVNWNRQVIKAVGHGVLPGDIQNLSQANLMARAAAVTDAYRNLAMMVYGVRVTGDTKVKNYVTESDEVRTHVEGMIRGAEIVSEKQLSDRTFEIILQMPMTGDDGLMEGLAEEVFPDRKSAGPDDGAAVGPISGLVIDASGLGVKPAMCPKVYDESGNEVYGTVRVSPDYAVESGIAVYPDSIEQASKSPRTGSSPLVVKAIRKSTKFDCDLVLSNADADRIRDAEKSSQILSRCRVSIVTGTASPSANK